MPARTKRAQPKAAPQMFPQPAKPPKSLRDTPRMTAQKTLTGKARKPAAGLNIDADPNEKYLKMTPDALAANLLQRTKFVRSIDDKYVPPAAPVEEPDMMDVDEQSLKRPYEAIMQRFYGLEEKIDELQAVQKRPKTGGRLKRIEPPTQSKPKKKAAKKDGMAGNDGQRGKRAQPPSRPVEPKRKAAKPMDSHMIGEDVGRTVMRESSAPLPPAKRRTVLEMMMGL